MSAAGLHADDLDALGVRAGATLLVHASLRRVGVPADTVVGELRDVLGPDGTLVVPAFTAGNSDTSPEYHSHIQGMTDSQLSAYRAQMPPFDLHHTPSLGMGRLAEAVRRSPDAVRSGHPQTSFAAVGTRAGHLMADHDEECHLGESSPLARLYAADARVLLIGVGYAVCSAFHLAEYRIPDPPRREYRCVVLRDGRRHWMSYKDVDLDDSDFGALGAAYEAHDAVLPEPAVRHGRLGAARLTSLPLRAAVDFATGWLAGKRPRPDDTERLQNESGFLH
ncbi:aminoglycoside 3-N-acetyltransferase [Streptomyces sp. cf386]|uniref:aminoglycoside N(3)-acetyltransferase n=1 Tax=Streptomyces sp. cf386 TaxID=1761904 RepID=UPI00088443CC|nr:AAC(3) family N-acetyltransferase [Streptomyces sp. cf386]SDN33967.1 aminoglycoside 3-N-acetyltransferase [Streptomyces sp. cf386]